MSFHTPRRSYLLAFLLPVAVPAQAPTPAQIRTIDSVFAAYAKPNTPGCALAVTRQGRIIYEHGYGLASIEQQVPITPATVFDLGSVSKQFTATSILMLQLDGKLSLDDDVRRYLPELPDLGATVTLRHLITHTSGWRDYNDLLILDGYDERDHTTDRDAWTSLQRQRALNFPPGSTYRYSNTGFFLLGEVVRRVSGKTLAQFAQERIFVPLGMTSTRYLDDTRQIVPHRATAYAPEGNGYVVEMSDWDQVGDGAVQSNVRDLARWEANLTTGTVGGARLLALLMTNGRLNDGREIAYTAGLNRMRVRGVERVSHSGAWAGYRAAITHYPQEQVGVLVTCNRADAATTTLSAGVAATFVKFTPPAPIRVMPGPKPQGLYVSEASGGRLRLSAHGDTLVLGGGAGATRLSEATSGTWVNTTGTFELSGTGDRVITNVAGDVPDTLVRVETTPAPSAGDLAQYVGRYVSPEIGVPYEFMVRGDTLVLRLPRGNDMPLEFAYRDAFDTNALPTLRFVRDAGGRVVAVSFTGRGVHDLRLARLP